MNYNLEELLFLFVGYVKKFHNHFTQLYKLSDIPFNSSGKFFPKKGQLIIEGNLVNYDFHGGGCTFYWNEIEIFYNTDAASIR